METKKEIKILFVGNFSNENYHKHAKDLIKSYTDKSNIPEDEYSIIDIANAKEIFENINPKTLVILGEDAFNIFKDKLVNATPEKILDFKKYPKQHIYNNGRNNIIVAPDPMLIVPIANVNKKDKAYFHTQMVLLGFVYKNPDMGKFA